MSSELSTIENSKIKMQKSKLNNKKFQEVECIKKFLRNGDIQFQDNEIKPNLKEDDVVDVYFKNEKFQVVNTPFELYAVEGQVMKGKRVNTGKIEGDIKSIQGIETPWIEFGYKKEEVFQKFIIEPIKKKAKYGESAKGIILLLNCWTHEPPWVAEQLKLAKKLSTNVDFLKNTGFKEIYLVCSDKNIQIFP